MQTVKVNYNAAPPKDSRKRVWPKRIREYNDKESRRRQIWHVRVLARTRALMLLGGMCEDCGINDSRVLQFDHINGGGQKEIREGMSPNNIPYDVLKNPGKYQILCANCNQVKKFEMGEDQNGRESRHG